MRRILLLENPIRDYAWGSRTAIAQLLGEPSPTDRPQAELWIGAHPAAPSQVRLDGRRVSLEELVAQEPEAILGRSALARFGPRLPFLAKLLAAASPLSIQAHPDAAQARAGFAREEALGIPADSDRRSYRDSSHKPELLCALEPFEGLCGFRPPAEIQALVERLGAAEVRDFFGAALAGEAPLARLFGDLLRLDPGRRRELVKEAAAAAGGAFDAALAWIPRLATAYPDDAGALAPLFLHLIRLEPGDAIFLPPRELHSYLRGFAVEVTASSDNVLRGGLTAKHVDRDELLRILRFEPRSTGILRAEADASGAEVYRTPAEEFEVSTLRIAPGRGFEVGAEHGVEVLLCTRGSSRAVAGGEAVELAPGRSCLVPAAAGPYQVAGQGAVWRVTVPAAAPARAPGSAAP